MDVAEKRPRIAFKATCLIIDILCCIISVALMFLVATQGNFPEYPEFEDVKIGVVFAIAGTAISFVISAGVLILSVVDLRKACKKKKINTSVHREEGSFYV